MNPVDKRIVSMLAFLPLIAGWLAEPVLADQDDSSSIETVTVTARKHSERLVDVPVAATALSDQRIEQYATADMTQIANIAPGLFIDRTGGSEGTNVQIRGVGIIGIPDYNSEQPVALVIDGMPLTRGHVLDAAIFDMDDIEVLKGPQALYFGKNSPAGVISFKSKDPSDVFEGYARASYEFQTKDPVLEAAVSIPLDDTLGVRFAIRGEDMQGGYIDNVAGPGTDNFPPADFDSPLPGRSFDVYPKTKSLSGRFTAVWKPSEDFDATFKSYGSFYKNDAGYGMSKVVYCNDGSHPYYENVLIPAYYPDPYGTCAFDRNVSSGGPSQEVLSNFRYAPSDGKTYADSYVYINTMTLNYRLPSNILLTSVSGWSKQHAEAFDNYDATSFGGVPGYQKLSMESFTEELRARTDFNFPVNVMVGAFFEHEHNTTLSTNRIAPFGLYPIPGPWFGASNTLVTFDNNTSEDYSLFGQVTWQITDNLELAGGMRWTNARKKSDLTNLFNWFDALYPSSDIEDQFGNTTFSRAGVHYYPQTHYQNTSPEVTLTWHPIEDLTVYGAYKTGFMAGGIENPGTLTNFTAAAYALSTSDSIPYAQALQQVVSDNATFGPEKVKGEEFGIKGVFLDNRLSGDLTFFHYQYFGLQVATFHSDTTSFTISNAASSLSEGVEFQASYRVDEYLMTHGWIEYALNRYSRYPDAACYTGQTVAEGCTLRPDGSYAQDRSGHSWGASPLTVDLGADYDRPISTDYSIGVGGDFLMFTRTPIVDGEPPNASTPAHNLLNGSIRFYPSDDAWEVALIGTNILNTYSVNVLGTKPLGKPGDIVGIPNQPREIRLQVTARF